MTQYYLHLPAGKHPISRTEAEIFSGNARITAKAQ